MRYPNKNTGFLDLLFLLVTCIFGLFVISFLIASEQKRVDQNIKTKAEYIITVVWPDGIKDDVDTWLMDPRGEQCWYRVKNIGTAHLDRDDIGRAADYIIDANGNKIEYKHNQEITTIRMPIEGEWVLNIHMYKKWEQGVPTVVEVKMDKLNPSVKTIFLQKIVIEKHWEEVTVARFQMSKAGDILFWNTLPKAMIDNVIGGFGYLSTPISTPGEQGMGP